MFRFHRISVRGSLLTHHPPPRSGQGRFPRLASLASVFEGAQPAYSSSFLLDIGGAGLPSTFNFLTCAPTTFPPPCFTILLSASCTASSASSLFPRIE